MRFHYSITLPKALPVLSQPQKKPLAWLFLFARLMGADPTASRVTGGCSTVELQSQIPIGNKTRLCRRWGSNPRPQAYESCALPTELPRQKANCFAFCRWQNHELKQCDDARISSEPSLQALCTQPSDWHVTCRLLRGYESNVGLKVMSLMRCHFSTPRYIYNNQYLTTSNS